jgi:cytosine/creatinine deaminase
MSDPRAGANLAQPSLLAPVSLPVAGGAHAVEISGNRIVSIRPVDAVAEWVLFPAFVNMHAHAERSFAPAPAPRSFADAVRQAAEMRRRSSEADFQRRAETLFARALSHGTTRLRSHTDIDDLVEDRALRGVDAARTSFAGRLDVEIAAFANSRVDPATCDGRRRILDALGCGANLIGAAPNSAPDPRRAVASVLDLARAEGVDVDFHLDEHGDVERTLLRCVLEGIAVRGLEGRVAISHACALALAPPAQVEDIARRLAAVGATVIVLPATNLYLQDRSQTTPRRRGLAPVLELLAAGVRLRLGSDNVRDSFYPYGDADPLEDAFLLSLAAHLDNPAALLAALCDGSGDPAVGDIADIVLVRAGSFVEALAQRPQDRIVMRGGKVVG